MSLYAIWTVRSALEEQQQPSDVTLAAAAVWFVTAAPALRDLSREEKTFDGKVAKTGPLFKGEEWKGFTKGRWRSWGQRFSDVQGQIGDRQTGRLVELARTAMGDVAER